MRFLPFSFPILFLASLHAAQLLTCTVTSVPLTMRVEGVTEATGDINLDCSGGQGSRIVTGSFSLFLNVPITNRIASGNVTDVQFTYDNGGGPRLVSTPAVLTSGLVSFSGASFQLSAEGSVNLRFSNLRGNVTQLLAGQNTITAAIAVNSADLLPLNQSQVIVGYVQSGLLDGFTSVLICEQKGSLAPSKPSFAAFLAAGTAFSSTRVTEGFASSFEPLSNFVNFNADNGQRIMLTYSGFPASAQIMTPDVIAGSDALRPTSAGDFGVPASGGEYAPMQQGTLLLARVNGADATGAGGKPVYMPGAIESGAVSFDSLSVVPMTNGTGSVVYEVMDANAFTLESAQVPAFLVLPPGSVSGVVVTTEQVSFAAVSTAGTADPKAPVPRFSAVTPAADCMLLGDCDASYFPRPTASPKLITFSTIAGGKAQAQYAQIGNGAGGILTWQATITYTAGQTQNWLQVSPAAGINAGSIYVYADPAQLSAGTYQATITISSVAAAPAATIGVSFDLAAGPPANVPTIGGITSAADFHQTTVSPGSLATIFGTNFGASGASVTFGSAQATIFFQDATQLNLLVPSSLVGQASAPVVVTANGVSSAPATVALAPFAPGVFANGVLNQNNSWNGAKNAAQAGTIVQIFATGLSGTGTIQAKLGATPVRKLQYAGPAPGLMGVQQVNMKIPLDTPVGTSELTLCGTGSAGEWFNVVACGAAYPIYVGN